MNSKKLLSGLLFFMLFFGLGKLSAQDTIPPVIVYDYPYDTQCISINSVWQMQYSVTDNKTSSSNIIISIIWGFNGPVNTVKRGTYPVTIEATDEDNNKSELKLNLRVEDCILPVITLNTPDTVCVKYRTPYNSVEPTVTDNYYTPGQISLVMLSSDVDPNVIGIYTEVFEAVDGSGNRTTKTRIVKVSENCPGSTTGLNDLVGMINFIYPQPADKELNLILYKLDNNVQVKIFSHDGKLVFHNNGDDTLSIETSAWPAGIYTMVVSGHTALYTYKVIIQH